MLATCRRLPLIPKPNPPDWLLEMESCKLVKLFGSVSSLNFVGSVDWEVFENVKYVPLSIYRPTVFYLGYLFSKTPTQANQGAWKMSSTTRIVELSAPAWYSIQMKFHKCKRVNDPRFISEWENLRNSLAAIERLHIEMGQKVSIIVIGALL